MHTIVFAAALLAGSVHARKSAGGPCLDITDKEDCCQSYDLRSDYESASYCVWSDSGFTTGKCEAEGAVIARGECAAVGSCRAHVPVSSAKCLALVIDQVKITASL